MVSAGGHPLMDHLTVSDSNGCGEFRSGHLTTSLGWRRSVCWQFADRTKRPTSRVVSPVLAVNCTCSDNNRPPPDRRRSPVVAFIDPKRACLSAHPPCAPGQVGLSGMLVPGGKPQKISELQDTELELAVPKLASDATRRRRGAPCCGVWRRVGWMLALPLRRLSRP